MKYLTLFSVLVLLGCAEKETKASWVSIEKPPIRVIYVSKVENIPPEVVNEMVQSIKDIPYANYPFNPSVKIGLDAKAHTSDSETDVASLTIAR